MFITQTYSGVVVDQNAPVTGSINWRSAPYNSQTVYQTFWLPNNYEMGTTSIEQRFPDLSGFQVMVSVDVGYDLTATLNYTLDYYVLGSGWTNLTSGVTIGCHVGGQCWFDVIFPESVPMNGSIASSQMRFGITTTSSIGSTLQMPVTTVAPGTYLVGTTTVYANLISEVPYPVEINGVMGFLYNYQGTITYSVQEGVGTLWYTTSSPLLPSGYAYRSDCSTPLLGTGTTASLDFRILSLSADSGTDFLGNGYRSCVIRDSGANTDTGSSHWMSTAQPSSFAVVSRYFDVRPVPSSPVIGVINMATNPSLEYDTYASTTPFAWAANDWGVTRNNLQVVGSWAQNGVQSLRSTSTFTNNAISPTPNSGVISPASGTAGWNAQAGTTYSAECVVNVLSLPGSSSGVTLSLAWYNTVGALISISSSNAATVTGVQVLSINGIVAPATTVYVAVVVSCSGAVAGTLDFILDSVQLTTTPTVVPYFDGDTPGCGWLGQVGHSISTQFADVVPGNSIVIDSVLVDPITPNMAFNVYYSTDDSGDGPTMIEADWEQKLWTRVPQAYVATSRQQYVFPEPIIANYVKLEFTNLPAQTYSSSTFQQPTLYKKFPTWVADYFILQLELPSFVAGLVNVQNDALTFAYNYYLDDLDQSPSSPVALPTDTVALSNYFSQGASGLVDATTLSQINFVMSSFQVPTGSLVNPNSILGSATQQIVGNVGSAPSLTVEVPTPSDVDYSIVSTLQRESVLFDQSMPVMFFFIPCRHTYKELSATFTTGKAYYAGTNDIAFLRSNYATTTDSDLYVESGGDTANALRNDFFSSSDGNWETYAS